MLTKNYLRDNLQLIVADQTLSAFWERINPDGELFLWMSFGIQIYAPWEKAFYPLFSSSVLNVFLPLEYIFGQLVLFLRNSLAFVPLGILSLSALFLHPIPYLATTVCCCWIADGDGGLSVLPVAYRRYAELNHLSQKLRITLTKHNAL